jgi:lipopolysaccharide/colanic/teichoic acid biosynthesis glycosyltransferase
MNKFFTRFVDLVLAAAGFFLFLPVNLVIALFIILEDKGPVFFLQERAGRKMKPFLIVKFRTMNHDRVTKIGKWIRTHGLDEIPQIINVLKGEMSIVGPRPLKIEDVRRLGWDQSFYQARFAVNPGITGLAQLYGGIGRKISVLLDKVYVQKKSLFLDIRIIFLSFMVNIVGKKKVRELLRDEPL